MNIFSLGALRNLMAREPVQDPAPVMQADGTTAFFENLLNEASGFAQYEDALVEASEVPAPIMPIGNRVPLDIAAPAETGKVLPPASLPILPEGPVTGQAANPTDEAVGEQLHLPQFQLPQALYPASAGRAVTAPTEPQTVPLTTPRGKASALIAPAETHIELPKVLTEKTASKTLDRIAETVPPAPRSHALPEQTSRQSQETAITNMRAGEQSAVAPVRNESPAQQPTIAPSSNVLPLTTAPLAPNAASSPPTPSDTARPLETLIDNLVQARENGRAARGDMVLRHAEFGTVALQIDRSDADMRAVISSRDPGFAPAAQAALAERAQTVQQAPATSQPDQAGGQSRSSDQHQTFSQQRDGQWSQHGERGDRGERGNQQGQRREERPMTGQTNSQFQNQPAGERGMFA